MEFIILCILVGWFAGIVNPKEEPTDWQKKIAENPNMWDVLL